MIRWMGGLLIVASCAAAGVQGRQMLRRRVRDFMEAEQLTELIRNHVCGRRAPLPGILKEVERRFPVRFAGADDTYQRMNGLSFSEYWRACLHAGGFDPAAVGPLAEAVEAIVAGQSPERVLEYCSALLAQRREDARKQEQEKGRIYMAFSTAAGCLITLILL